MLAEIALDEEEIHLVMMDFPLFDICLKIYHMPLHL
jgi:hypothetical protein